VRSEATSLEPLEVPASMYGIAAVPLAADEIDDNVRLGHRHNSGQTGR
jgi:hypothetical protein